MDLINKSVVEYKWLQNLTTKKAPFTELCYYRWSGRQDELVG